MLQTKSVNTLILPEFDLLPGGGADAPTLGKVRPFVSGYARHSDVSGVTFSPSAIGVVVCDYLVAVDLLFGFGQVRK